MTTRATVPTSFIALQYIAKGNGSFADSLTLWITSRRAISNNMLLFAGVQTSSVMHWRLGVTLNPLTKH